MFPVFIRCLAAARRMMWQYHLVLCVFIVSSAAYAQPPGTIISAAGTGSPGFSGDGGPADQAQLHLTFGLAADEFGAVYIADAINYRIRKIAPDGAISTVAGIGTFGYAGDGGPARQAKLDTPFDVAVDESGNLYIADTFNHRIRQVSPEGIITTIAGRRGFGYSGDDGPATQAKLQSPFGVSVGPDGSVYIADTFNHRIRRVGSDGVITTVAGNGQAGYAGDGTSALQAQLRLPFGVSVGPDGSVYIADTFNHRIRRVGPDGVITTVAGNGQAGYVGDGMQARTTSLFNPKSVTVDENGAFYIADTDNHRVRHVDSDGIITTVLGDGIEGYGGDGGPALDARLHEPYDFITDMNGSMFISDSHNYRIRRVSGALRTLFVDTDPEGLGADMTVAEDAFGRGNALSPLRRQYAYGEVIDLTAPHAAGGLAFQKWTMHGQDFSPAKDLSISMTRNLFLRATYVVPPDTLPPTLLGTLSLRLQGKAVHLQWQETPDEDLDAYMLFRNEAPNVSITDFLAALNESKTTYADTSIVFGETYAYRLAVRDTAGNMSHLSAPVLITIPVPPDTIPPAAPAGLSAVGSEDRIDLIWSGVAAGDLAGYALYRSRADKSSPDSTEVRALLPPHATAFTDSAVAPGDTYYFWLAAQDTVDNASPFVRVSATVPLPPDTIPPAEPTGVDIFAVDGQVFLQWTASPAPDLAHYLLFRGENEQPANDVPRAQTPPGQTTFVDAQVTTGRTYRYYLVAVDSAGNRSANSETVQAVLQVVPDRSAPNPPVAPVAELIQGMIALTWIPNTEPDLADYLVLKSESAGFTGPDSLGWVTQTALGDSAVVMETTYYYRLVARDQAGNISSPGDILAITTPAPPDTTPPPPPHSIVAETVNGRVLLQWQSSPTPDLAAFAILRNPADQALAIHTDTLAWTPQATYTDSAVQSGRTYSYCLIARDSTGNASEPSETVQVLVPLPQDTTPPVVLFPDGVTPVKENTVYNLTVTASDDRAVSMVKIAYQSLAFSTSPDTLIMNNPTDDVYEAVLPVGVMKAPGVEITAVAYDEAGNFAETEVRMIPVIESIHEISLLQNTPNPFNPITSITFTLPHATHVVLEVYNMLGQVVKTLIDETQPEGKHTILWNGRNQSGSQVASGLYIYRMQIETTVLSRKMVLLR